jgi:AAA family ATP:ADP antiporter
MTGEIGRKVKAVLLIAMTVGAEVRQAQQDVRFNARFNAGPTSLSSRASEAAGYSTDADAAGANMKSMLGAMAGDAKFQDQGRAFAEMEAMMQGMMPDAPSFQNQEKLLASKLDALLADPKVQEQAEILAQRFQASGTEPKSENFRELAEQVKALQSDPQLQKQEKDISEQMEAMMAEPRMKLEQMMKEGLPEGAEPISEKMQEEGVMELMKSMMADPNFEKQAAEFAKQMEGLTGAQEQAEADPNMEKEGARFKEQMEGLKHAASQAQEQGHLFSEMEAAMADPAFQRQLKGLKDKMSALKDDPMAQEQAKAFGEQLGEIMKPDPEKLEQAKDVMAAMEAMMAEPSTERASRVTKEIKGMMADPEMQERAMAFQEHMDAIMARANVDADVFSSDAQDTKEDLADKQVDDLVDRLFDRAMAASGSPKEEEMEKTTLGKAGHMASPAVQSRPTRSTAFPTMRRPSSSSRLGLKLRPYMAPLAATAGRMPDSGDEKVPVRAGGIIQGIKDFMPTPIERKKMLPLTGIFFCILFCYTVLRDTKDVLVVTSGGAEVIPFLKTYMNLPAAIGFTALYSILVNKMSNQQVFYTLVTTFAVFFGSFATIIYPNRNVLHPLEWATNTAASLPAGFGPPLAIIKFWTFGLFYTFAELWGSVVVSLLFWGFANEICSVSEAKKWYPLFGLIANVALIFSGQFIRKVSDIRAHLPPGVDAWGYSLNILMAAVVTGALTMMGIYTYMQKYVMTDPAVMPQAGEKKGPKKKKPSMGLAESFKYLTSSSYIRNLAFLVICYGISINIVEVSWKGKLKAAFPDPNDYSSFMGAFSTTTGCTTFAMMLIGRWILDKFGWGTAALVTPVMLGVTGISFFSLILFKDAFSPLTAAIGLSPLMMAVLVGAAQNILSKASKYSLFDPCKETAYIPLDAEMRTKGKAAIDVIGNPLGKSGGAFIQQAALLTCGSLAASTPFLGAVLVGQISLWILASRELAVEFEEKSKAMEAAKDEPEGTDDTKKDS